MEDDPTDEGPPKPRATLYRLIAAGQLVHRALLTPLIERGLQPGDDAVLLLLWETNGMTEGSLAEALGLEIGGLTPRFERLCGRELIQKRAVGAELLAGFALTERGERIAEALAGSWSALEAALLGDLDRKSRRRLDKALKHVLSVLDW